jgi:hypothetical protein
MSSTIYEKYLEIKNQFSYGTIVAMQIEDNFKFYNDDAVIVADSLGLDILSENIGWNRMAEVVNIPLGDSKTSFAKLIEDGLTLGIGEYSLSEKKSEKEPEKSEEPKTGETIQAIKCSRCGKLLTAEKSVAQGMGDTCAHHASLLKGVTFEQHYSAITLSEMTEDWIPFSKFLEAGPPLGISKHRMMQASGGDRALRKPVHPSFKVHYYKGSRFVSKDALDHIEEARLR